MALTSNADTRIKYASNDTSTPDVAGANFLRIFGTEVRDMFKKDTTYIPFPKGYSNHFQGPTTLALDFLKSEFTFQLTGRVYNGKDGLYTMPASLRDSNDDGVITGEDMTFSEFGTADNPVYVLMGATNIKNGSETLTRTDVDPDNDLVKDTDYTIDYDRGRINLIDTADTSTGGSYEVDYTFSGDPYNLATMIRRMSQLGGNALLETDRTAYTASSGESGRQYMVQFDTVEIVRQALKPEEVEITLEARVALDRD